MRNFWFEIFNYVFCSFSHCWFTVHMWICVLRFCDLKNTVCPTRYRTRHFFNNSNTNEDISGVRSLCEKWKGMCLYCLSLVRFKFLCNILISGKIIKEMPSSVASGTPYIWNTFVLFYVLFVLCCSVYCLCVNVYCTSATGWQPNYS